VELVKLVEDSGTLVVVDVVDEVAEGGDEVVVVGSTDVDVVGAMVVDEVDEVDVGATVVVVLVDVVVSSGGQSAGNSTTAVAVSPELAYVRVSGVVRLAGYGNVTVWPDWKTSGLPE